MIKKIAAEFPIKYIESIFKTDSETFNKMRMLDKRIEVINRRSKNVEKFIDRADKVRTLYSRYDDK